MKNPKNFNKFTEQRLIKLLCKLQSAFDKISLKLQSDFDKITL